MRVASWRGPEVFQNIYDHALDNANAFMDDVVAAAKTACPVGDKTIPGGWSSAQVQFTPKTGRNKGKLVSFGTQKRWKGRYPGQLRDTIRRVNARHRPGNIRVYAGSHKVYYAHFVERGTVKMAKKPFLRPAFNQLRGNAVSAIKHGK